MDTRKNCDRKKSFDSRCFSLEPTREGPQPPAHNRTGDGSLSLLMHSLVPDSRLASCHPEPMVKKRDPLQRSAEACRAPGYSPEATTRGIQERAGLRRCVRETLSLARVLPIPSPAAVLPFLHLLVALLWTSRFSFAPWRFSQSMMALTKKMSLIPESSLNSWL